MDYRAMAEMLAHLRNEGKLPKTQADMNKLVLVLGEPGPSQKLLPRKADAQR